ncbi:hypothetical protein BOX15_Mlig006615g1 [Macrostomum lignano]|uniref:Papilin n=1 Tax=Macrostomum lignano TaxID=282301 RepID=A0A267GYM5_9PLAT|nr:hypothetical protein BOX15_Mlig006615g1 [Macrostomum lignano]
MTVRNRTPFATGAAAALVLVLLTTIAAAEAQTDQTETSGVAGTTQVMQPAINEEQTTEQPLATEELTTNEGPTTTTEEPTTTTEEPTTTTEEPTTTTEEPTTTTEEPTTTTEEPTTTTEEPTTTTEEPTTTTEEPTTTTEEPTTTTEEPTTTTEEPTTTTEEPTTTTEEPTTTTEEPTTTTEEPTTTTEEPTTTTEGLTKESMATTESGSRVITTMNTPPGSRGRQNDTGSGRSTGQLNPLVPTSQPTPSDSMPILNFEPCRQETSQGDHINGMSDSRAITVYGYQPNQGRCMPYNYYGSAGSSNRFDSIESCENSCQRRFEQSSNINCSFEEATDCIDYDSSKYSSSSLVYYYVKKIGTCIQAVLKDTAECSRLGETKFFQQKQACSDLCVRPATDSVIQDRCFAVFKSEKDGTFCPFREKKYFYNEQTKQCISRQACGTEVVSNSFASLEECQKFCLPRSVAELCSLPRDPGSCEFQGKKLLRYYYDSEQLKCQPFSYSGCHGNKNRFFDEADCRKTCVVAAATAPPPRASLNSSRLPTADDQPPLLVEGSVCRLPPSAGSCPMTDGKRLLRYFYDPTKDECRTFKYTGCGGNGNNFETGEDCHYACRNYNSSRQPLCQSTAPACPPGSLCEAHQKLCSGSWMALDMMQDRCQLPKDAPTPPSAETETRNTANSQGQGFYFDYKTFNCYQSMGRHGIGMNFFKSWDECKSFCYPEKRHLICFLESDPGPCKANLKRYYFNQTTGACEEMTYGGCLGNRNRFLTMSECKNMCEDQLQRDPCLYPPSHGQICPGQTPEVSRKVMYFYRGSTKNCYEFTYKGCGGSRNLFASGEQCKEQCRASRVVKMRRPRGKASARSAAPTAARLLATTTSATTTTSDPTTTAMEAPTPTTTFGMEKCLSESPEVVTKTPAASCPDGKLQKVFVFKKETFSCEVFQSALEFCGDTELRGAAFWSRSACESACPVATKKCPTSSPCPTDCKYKRSVQQLDSSGCLICRCFDPCEGKCPPTERCKASCNDEQCSEVIAKCLALTRPGDCPPLKISGDACERQCDFDLDCPDERQKCCQSGCAQGRSCQNPYVTPPPPTTNRPPQVPCDKTPHGCCPDGETTADNPSLTNCPPFAPKSKFPSPMQSIVVLEGVRLKLDCGFLAVPKPTVMWLKDNRPVVQDQRVRIDGQKLKLRQVTESDSGEYECSAYNSEGQAARKISLAVQVPATILSLEAPEQPLLVRGEQIQLICNATGKPKPEIRWLKYDQTIPGEIADTLNLTVGPAAVAEYTCRAENEAGPPVQAKTSIEFREPLRAAVEVISPAGKTEEGGRIRLQSQLKAGYPAPFLYLWFKEVQQSESSTNGSVATAAPLGTGMSLDLDPLKLSHSGRYFLRVTNQFETVESERVTVTVMSQCGDVQCDTRCRYGYQRDNKTCSTCQCINPCQDNTCNKGQVCRPFCLDINDCTKFQTECISADTPPPDCLDQDAEYCSLVLQNDARACEYAQAQCCSSCFAHSLARSRDED